MKLLIFILFGLIILFLILNKSNNLKENYTNLIDNGSFEDGKFSKNNVGSNLGNTIVKKINPGKTSYVLRQTGKIGEDIKKTRYQMSVKVIPGAEYIIDLWVLYDKLWNGNKNLFNITLHKDCGDSEIIIQDGIKKEDKLVDNHLWEKRALIFNIPNNSNGKIDIYIGYDPQNSLGYRWITDINLQRYYPLIKDLPVKDNLILYVSGHKSESFENNKLIWNDISMNGRDFKFNDRVSLLNKNLDILSQEAKGHPSNIIVPKENSFSFIWSCSMNEFTKGTFLEIFANNKSNIGIKIDFNNKVGINNEVNIYIGGLKYTYKIGISQKKTTYILTRKDNLLEFYVDGFKINPKNTKGSKIDNLEINNKNILMNPKGKLKFKISNLIIYSDYLTPHHISKMTEYIDLKKNINNFCRPDINDRNCSCSIDTKSDKVNISVKPHLISEINNYKTTTISEQTDSFINETGTISKKTCPFTVKCEESPCNTLECQGSDWHSFNVSDKCKKVINNYCKKNKNNDLVCDKLKTIKKNKNNSTCASSNVILNKLKKQLKNTKKNTKKQNNTENQKNKASCPDMSKYIRKDKIPCWGCNLK